MSKILATAIVFISSLVITQSALAWEDRHKDSNGYDSYSTNNNEPKGYSPYNRSRNDNNSDRYSNTSEESYRGSSGAYKSDSRHNTQINNNGLIINRE